MEKVESIDLKTGEPIASETGQAEKEEVKTEEVEKVETKSTEEVEKEDVESLPQWAKNRLSKVEEEKENYKKGMFKYKGKTLEKEPEKEEKEEIYPDWDETSKKFQEQTLAEAEKKAELKAQAIIEKANEKSAIQSFISQHPELEDDAKWQEVISNYTSKNSKETAGDIIRDLERAYILARYEKGEISQIEADALKKGEVKGKAEAQLANQAAVSKTTAKSGKEWSSVSQGAQQLAKGLRIDPEKLAEVGDSNEASIKF